MTEITDDVEETPLDRAITRIEELETAYTTLWIAIEDGAINNDTFFKYREMYREVINKEYE